MLERFEKIIQNHHLPGDSVWAFDLPVEVT